MGKVILTKVENAPYKCHATYEYKEHTISADGSSWFNGGRIWRCETLFRNSSFRTLKGLKHAIELKENGELNSMNLSWCEEE